MVGMTSKLQEHVEQENGKNELALDKACTDLKLKEDECKKVRSECTQEIYLWTLETLIHSFLQLTEKVVSLQSAINDEKKLHKLSVSKLKDEMLSLQASKDEIENLLAGQTKKMEDEEAHLKKLVCPISCCTTK